MSDLTTLDNERHTSLLAEVSGVLHNTGKLYPNFLAQRVIDAEQALRIVRFRVLGLSVGV